MQVQTALYDNTYEGWDSIRALSGLKRAGLDEQVPALAQDMLAACLPIAKEKLHQRLTALGMTMAANRAPAEATMWLHETARLLSDIAEDVLCGAIDDHQHKSSFLPTVAEIRAIADPRMEERRREAARLDAMARLIASGQPLPKLAPPPSRPLLDRRGEAMTDEECEELNRILAGLGATTRYNQDGSRTQAEAGAGRREPNRPRRKPTRADYIALGVDPSVLDQMEQEPGA